jgi:hypothetical protein
MVVVAALLASTTAGAEDVATSCADCPNYSAAFSIRNDTGQTIKYQRRWGNGHQWTQMVLQTGRVETHTYPLGEDPHGKVPTPYIRFDDVANDGRTTFKEYRMEFFATGYAGYGPKVNKTEPKRYYFRYAPDGRHLDLLAE